MNSTRRFLLILLSLTAIGSVTATAQLCSPASDTLLLRQLVTTGMVHAPLPTDDTYSVERAELQKPVLRSHTLHADTLTLSFATSTGKRAVGSPDDPDYATYGNRSVSVNVGKMNDWSDYNRLYFEVFPVSGGARVVNLNVQSPAGSHLVNLTAGRWNHCTLNLDGFERTQVNNLSFRAALNGRDRVTADTLTYYIRQVSLQQVEHPLKSFGWMPQADAVIYSTTGYLTHGSKVAIINGETRKDKHFRLMDATSGKEVLQGKVDYKETTIGKYGILDFSKVNRQGNYRLRVGSTETEPFRIADNLWDNSLWRTVSFLFGQRCGCSVPGVHSTCHLDLFSEHNGQRISYSGGWHDAGDLSQQTLQTGDVTFALLEAYRSMKHVNPALAARLLEEAEWGLEFILRQRYGDGYRASSMGLLIWLDGVEQTFDDIRTVRLQNHSFDNFLYAGYEAYAAMTIERDPVLTSYLMRVAREDYDFAMEQYRREGIAPFRFIYEHSYSTSESQYIATVAWTAALLYQLTGEHRYAADAADFGNRLLSYQVPAAGKDEEVLSDNYYQIIPAAGKGKEVLGGYFIRDLLHRAPVHFNHQSRDAIYMQALTLLCTTLSTHPDVDKWASAIRLYGNYLKALMPYTAPYGMLPSGVYSLNEPDDSLGFQAQNIFAGADAPAEFEKYVRSGVAIDHLHYVRRFPPWFTIYNGNTAVMLATGKAAALCGRFLNDSELLNIAAEQLYWTVGKNPFGQSLIYGEGRNYPQLNNFSSGELTGAIPVGIRTLDETDVPYFPQTNNACYKEVWTTSAGKWISLVSSLVIP